MNFNLAKCPHVDSIHFSRIDLKLLEKPNSCNQCDYSGLNLWLCLYEDCHFIGCSEQANDHSTEHFQYERHAVHMNISSQRIWCYFCERELYLNIRSARSQDNLFSYSLSSFSTREDDSVSDLSNESYSGLVGLQNIANTCYMNSALQALSNLSPMTHYFLHCNEIVEHIVDQSAPRCKAAGLAKSYQRLMQEIWNYSGEDRDFITPRGILYGIRSVHPMFRGYQQHDTQEFLRCFMDQLHEELKDQDSTLSPVINIKAKETTSDQEHKNEDNEDDDKCSSHSSNTHGDASDSEYETCESSLSDRSTNIRNDPEVHIKTDYYAPPLRQHTSSEGNVIQPKQASPLAQDQQNHSLQRSIISDIFDGKLLSSVQCLTCDRLSTREETFQDLSLPIPTRDFLNVLHQTHSLSVQSLNAVDTSAARSNEGWLAWMWNIFRSWFYGPSVTLYDCMASFFSADELKGDNMYSCEKCNKLRTGIKYSRILNLPEVLCIHLKRFRHDLSYSSKIGSHVYFPLEGLDMRTYVYTECKSKVPTYNLTSVICHHGTVGSGHYTCYARNSLNGRWYEFDDQFVSEVAPETVQNCQAYVLFYQKYNPQMNLIREEAQRLSNTHPSQHSDIQFYISREWLTRLATFAEPGPINNQSILCPHGGVLQSKIQLISHIAVAISQPVWDFLYRTFGGGPAISMLFECEICKRSAEALAKRQFYELAVFTKYNGLQNELDSSAIYAIAMPWLRKWQQFSRGFTNKEPGPIDNHGIAAAQEPNAVATSTTGSTGVRPGSDYAQLNAPLWRFLHDIYGGGPEIMIRGSLTEEIEIIDQDEQIMDQSHVDISDTESNMGQRKTPELIELESTTTETTSVNSTPPKAVRSHPAVKDSRYSKTAITNNKKIKVNNLQNLRLRKNSNKQRNPFKNTDMFGAKGTYNSSSSNDVEQSAADQTCQSNTVTTTVLDQDEAFQTELNSSFQNEDYRVNNGISIGNTRLKGKNRSHEKITLQKYVQLPDPSESNETDV